MKNLASLLIILFGVIGLAVYGQNPIILSVNQANPLQADAGTDVEIPKGESVTLGGNPTALEGYGDYIYLWTPTTGLDDPTLANPTATPESNTTYILTVTDANNCSAISEVNISVDASGIDIKGSDPQINCFPNPVQDELIIEIMGVPTKMEIRLFNTMGNELVFHSKAISGMEYIERIPVSNLPAGLYYLQLISAKKTYYKSIIKTR